MSIYLSEQPSSTGGIEPTSQNDSNSEQSFLVPQSNVPLMEISARETKIQKTGSNAVNAATKKTADNDNTSEIINFLIEHDNASKNGETSPGNLLNSLLEECQGSQNEKMQGAVKNFDAKIENFQKNFKNTKNLEKLVIPSKSMLPPSASTHKLPHKIINEEFDQKVDNEVRKPLFEATKALVITKLKQTKDGIIETKSIANEDAFSQVVKNFSELRTEQMKYIALLSSIDREGTINLLQSDDGCMLLPTYLRNPDASPEVNYRNFLEDLYTLTHPAVNEKKAGQNTDKELLEKYGGNETEPLLRGLYSNLTLGRPLYKHGSHEILPMEHSPYKLGDMKLLKTYSQEVGGAYGLYKDWKVSKNPGSNQEFLSKQDLKKYKLDKIIEYAETRVNEEGKKIPMRAYRSKDKKLYIVIREVDEINLFDAKRLGLVTPEKAKELEEQGIKKITPMFIIPRWQASKRDARTTAAANIAGITADALKYADGFTGAVCRKIREGNGAHASPYVPVCAGFCMGAMTAQALSVKYNIPSLVFNPFNPDPAVLERFVGKKEIKRANDSDHALCHQAYRMKGDYISDPEFFQSSVRADVSKKAIDEKKQRVNDEFSSVSEAFKDLMDPKNSKNFKERIGSLSEAGRKFFAKVQELADESSIASKYKAENFLGNKPAVIGQSFFLDVTGDLNNESDSARHIDFDKAIATYRDLGGDGFEEDDFASKMISIIQKYNDIKQQIMTSIGKNEADELSKDKAIEQWVEISLTGNDVYSEIKSKIMKVVNAQNRAMSTIEMNNSLKKKIATLIGEKEITETDITNFVENKMKFNLDQIPDKFTAGEQSTKDFDNSVKENIQNIVKQNQNAIINGVMTALSKNPDIQNQVTTNIKNGDIEQWIKDNIPNSYEKRVWATTLSEENIRNIQEWVIQATSRGKNNESRGKNVNLKDTNSNLPRRK